MPDVPLSLVREEFEHVPPTFNVEDAAARRGNGLGHPGHDCWIFPRDWVPRLLISFTMVGVSMVATDLMQVLEWFCRDFMIPSLSPYWTLQRVDLS